MNGTAMHTGGRVLIVDDNEAIHTDFRKLLAEDADVEAIAEVESDLFDAAKIPRGVGPFETDSAYQGREALAMVEKAVREGRPYAVAFVDVRMPPGWDGIETVARLWPVDPDLHIVICTAYTDYSWDQMIDKLGFNDRLFVVKKPFDNVEVCQLAAALSEKRNLTNITRTTMERLERRVHETTTELSESETRVRAILEAAADGIIAIDAGGLIESTNGAAERLFGYSKTELVGRNINILMSDPHRSEHDRYIENYVRTGEEKILDIRREVIGLRKDGSTFPMDLHVSEAHVGQRSIFTGIVYDITERKRLENQRDDYENALMANNRALEDAAFETEKEKAGAELARYELERTQERLLLASRRAGMAEVATNVLHNVGNVLNSVNVSASVMSGKLRKSKVPNLAKAVGLMREHAHDLGSFITEDKKGKTLPGYLDKLAEHLADEQADMIGELEGLAKNIDHIKIIVNTQQSHAGGYGVVESVAIVDLIEDALTVTAASFERHGIELVRDFDNLPPILLDKHKLLQIMINLVRNAKHAVLDGGGEDRCVRLKVRRHGDAHVRIEVIDNGVGISTDNLTKVFSYGFTTKKGGQGYGLHGAALAAREMGGSLSAHSDGPRTGATFTVELPLKTAMVNA